MNGNQTPQPLSRWSPAHELKTLLGMSYTITIFISVTFSYLVRLWRMTSINMNSYVGWLMLLRKPCTKKNRFKGSFNFTWVVWPRKRAHKPRSRWCKFWWCWELYHQCFRSSRSFL